MADVEASIYASMGAEESDLEQIRATNPQITITDHKVMVNGVHCYTIRNRGLSHWEVTDIRFDDDLSVYPSRESALEHISWWEGGTLVDSV